MSNGSGEVNQENKVIPDARHFFQNLSFKNLIKSAWHLFLILILISPTKVLIIKL